MRSPTAKIIFFILAICLLGMLGFFLFVLSIFGMPLIYWISFLPALMFIRLLYVSIWDRYFLKKEKIRSSLFIVLPCILLLGFYLYEEHQKSIPILNDQLEVVQYQPFPAGERNPTLAHLESDPTLALKENLPYIDCATALYPIAAAFVEATYPSNQNYSPFEQNPKSVLQVNKTPQAYENLINGRVDILLVAGPSKEQLQAAQEKGVELVLTPIGKEGFVFFVHAQNPIEDLTIDEIREIYSGQMTNWRALGGRNQKIKAFQRDKNSGSQTSLEKIMDGFTLMVPPQEDRIQGMGGIIQATARYQNVDSALGFSFRFYSTQMVQNQQIKLLKIEGIAPTEENIRNGTYPLTSTFYAVTLKGADHENTQKLLEWILSAEGQELIQKTGYTPILSS